MKQNFNIIFIYIYIIINIKITFSEGKRCTNYQKTMDNITIHRNGNVGIHKEQR